MITDERVSELKKECTFFVYDELVFDEFAFAREIERLAVEKRDAEVRAIIEDNLHYLDGTYQPQSMSWARDEQLRKATIERLRNELFPETPSPTQKTKE